MNLIKLKIILSLPLALFFIANIFYYPLPVKAEENCAWLYKQGSGPAQEPCNFLQFKKESKSPATDCVSKPSACGDKPENECLCCCKTVTPSTLNDTMPNLKIPDINLQVTIPGLNLTKGAAIKCTEQGGKKTCNFPWIGEYIAGIYKYAIGIVGILAAVVLMVGGVLWIIAGGSATMIGEAKAWIGASLTGLVIALCSYVILYQVNPALVGFKGLDIQMVKKLEDTIQKAKDSSTAGQYAAQPCPTLSELTSGTNVYATIYLKPVYGTDHTSLCKIGMNCSCPSGRSTTESCADIYVTRAKNGFKDYACNTFTGDYCNKPAGTAPISAGNNGTIAIPQPSNCSTMQLGQQYCVNGVTKLANDYGATDTIKGKRIDIFAGYATTENINNAIKEGGNSIVNIKQGACQ